jgi:hypothetical protein
MVPRPVNRAPQLRSAGKLIGCPATGGDVITAEEFDREKAKILA